MSWGGGIFMAFTDQKLGRAGWQNAGVTEKGKQSSQIRAALPQGQYTGNIPFSPASAAFSLLGVGQADPLLRHGADVVVGVEVGLLNFASVDHKDHIIYGDAVRKNRLRQMKKRDQIRQNLKNTSKEDWQNRIPSWHSYEEKSKVFWIQILYLVECCVVASWFLRLCERISKLPVRNPVGGTSVLKHWQQQLLIRAIFTSTNELGGEKIPQPYLVSAILVAITIFLTPGGGLLNTWEEWETEMNLDFSYWKRKKMVTREKLTCVWLTVGMRECKGMMTNRSGKTEEQKQLKMFWLTFSTIVGGASSTVTSHSIITDIPSSRRQTPLLFIQLLWKYPIHLNSDPLPSYFI